MLFMNIIHTGLGAGTDAQGELLDDAHAQIAVLLVDVHLLDLKLHASGSTRSEDGTRSGGLCK